MAQRPISAVTRSAGLLWRRQALARERGQEAERARALEEFEQLVGETLQGHPHFERRRGDAEVQKLLRQLEQARAALAERTDGGAGAETPPQGGEGLEARAPGAPGEGAPMGGEKRAEGAARQRRGLKADALAPPDKSSGSEPPDSPESPGIMAQYRTISRKAQETAAEKQARASEAEAHLEAEREAHARVEQQLREEREARAEAEERAQAEAQLKAALEAQVRAEAEAREVAEARLQAEADARERALAAAREDAKAKLSQVISEAQMEQQARNEAQARLKAEEEARARAEAEAVAQAEAREAAEAAAKAEAEARVKAEIEMVEKLARAEDKYEALASQNEVYSTALAGAEARADLATQESKRKEADLMKEAQAKEVAEATARTEAESRAQAEARAEAFARDSAVEAQARAEAEARAEREAAARGLAEEKGAAEAAARTLAEEKVAAEAAARTLAEERVAAEAAARTLAEEKVAAESEALTRALNRQLELEARALATQSALLEAEARANAQAKAVEEAEAHASAQAKAVEEAEARASAQAKAVAEAEARASAQAEAAEAAEARAKAQTKAMEEAQKHAAAENQAAAAARAEVERLTLERAGATPDGGAPDVRRGKELGTTTPRAAAPPGEKMPPIEGKSKNVRRGLNTSDVVALSPGPHVHTLKDPAGAAGVCRRALPQVDMMLDEEWKEGDSRTCSQASPPETEGLASVAEKSPRCSPLDGSPRRARVADAASSPVHFLASANASTPPANSVDGRSMVSSPSLSQGAMIPETPTAELQPGSPSAYTSRLSPTVDTPLQNLEESWMESLSTVCTTQVFEAGGISESEAGVPLTPGLASQHSADHLSKPLPEDVLRGTGNVANGVEKPRAHGNDRLFRIIVEMNRKMNLMSEDLSEVRARNDARGGAYTMEVDALVAQLLPLSSQVESLSRKCESMEERLTQTEAQSRRISAAQESTSTEQAAAAQKKKKAAAPGRLTLRIETLEKSVAALQNQTDTLSSQHVKSTGRAGQWQRQAARGIGALESRLAGTTRAVEDTQALAFALAERLASVEAKHEERDASHAPEKGEISEAGGGAVSSGSIDADAKTSDSIFIFSAEKEESQAGAAEGPTTPPGSPPPTTPKEAARPGTTAAAEPGSAAHGRSETEEPAKGLETKQAAPQEQSVEDFLPALVRCQGLSHQLRQLESAVEASAVAQRRLEEHVEAAAVAADAADACLGSGDASEGESAAELEALGYESRVGRGAVLQATQAARRECVRMTSAIETEVLKRLDGGALPAQPRKGAATPGERKSQKDFFSCHASAERALDQEAVLRKLRQNSPEARRWNSSTSTNARPKSKHGWKKQAFKAVGISM